MANTARRKEYTDRNDNMFIPMNVEGGVWNEHFITTPKLLAIVGMLLALFIIIATLSSGDGSTLFGYIFYIGLWAVASSYILRFFIFEEKFYYKMYKELEKYEITSPALFWEIQSIRDTEDGALITYGDARIGVIVKLDRDTITGKAPDFKETHYDSISDFYRALATNKYSFVQMNIMEAAGKDPRLNELSKLVNKSDNPSVCKLMELEIGHIKNITNTALYESDYFLFYTHDMSKIDTIIDDISECIFKLLDGAYVGYTFLDNKEIVELVKELYGVRYFNSTEASLMMFGDNAMSVMTPFNITGLVWSDNNEQELTKQEVNKLRNITGSVIRGTTKRTDVDLKASLYRKNEGKKIGIDLDSALENRNSKIEERKRREEAKKAVSVSANDIFNNNQFDTSEEQDTMFNDMNTFDDFDDNTYELPDEEIVEANNDIVDDSNSQSKISLDKQDNTTNITDELSNKSADIADSINEAEAEIIDFGEQAIADDIKDDTAVNEVENDEDDEDTIDFGGDTSSLDTTDISESKVVLDKQETTSTSEGTSTSDSGDGWDDEIIDI